MKGKVFSQEYAFEDLKNAFVTIGKTQRRSQNYMCNI
jgi:hypothetical protein